jgi:hypothetical protein
MVKNKKCDCGHSKNEHILTQKNMSVLDIVLFHDRVATLQEGVGECMKCYCPEYKSLSKFNARRGVDYTLRTKKNDIPEKRCTRCGRLLVNHENIDHSFQYARTPL